MTNVPPDYDADPNVSQEEVDRWLSPMLYGASEKRHRQIRELHGLQRGFFDSIIAHPEFEAWQRGDGHPVLSCYGGRMLYLYIKL